MEHEFWVLKQTKMIWESNTKWVILDFCKGHDWDSKGILLTEGF